MLLQTHSSTMLSLENWDNFFHLMLRSKGHYEMIFKRMLWQCKYTKFREINFKILARILVTPKILSVIRGNGTLSAFVHVNRIWSSRASEKLDMRDTLVIHVEGHFLSACSKNDQVPEEEVHDSFYNPLDTMPDFVEYPVVLNKPVKHLKQRFDEIGLELRGSPCLLPLLAELSGLPAI